MMPIDSKMIRKSRPDISKDIERRGSKSDTSKEEEYSLITGNDLRAILDVNQKAIEIYIEVEKNQTIVMDNIKEYNDEREKFEKETKDSLEDLDKKITEIERLLFRLLIIISAIGTTTLAAAIPAMIKALSGK